MERNGKETLSISPQVSVAKALFLGNIVEESLFPFPTIAPDQAETLRIVLESIDKFMKDKTALFREYDRHGSQPPEYLEQLREMGLFGLIVPEEYGGLGLSNAGYSRVVQQVSRYDASTSLTIGAHSSIGMKGLLLFGSPAQKERYLPRLATGELIASFCLTEAGSGSDAGSISTSAIKNPDGSWTLNGEKIWITNGSFAGFFTVFARTNSEKGKISAFIVERGWDGVRTGEKEDKMGIRASATTTVRFENVRVPADCLLGEEGRGFQVAMSILNSGRTGLGGGSVGAMKQCIDFATRQACERKQFQRRIVEFGLVKEKLAQMTVDCFAAESTVSMVCHYIDSGVSDFSVEAAISKVFASEALWRVANEALQIAGGNGFMREFPYERVVRDSRINMIFEGTNEILRLYIALSGMKDAGEYLKEIGKGMGKVFNDPIKGFGVLSGYAVRKFSQLTSRGGDTVEAIHPALRDDSRVLELYTLRLSQATEALLRRYRKDVVEQQFAMKRVANVAIDLFVGFCVLSRVSRLIEESSVEKTADERAIAHIFCQQAKRRMNQELRRLAQNEDELLEGLAKASVDNQGYRWDTLD